MKVVEGQTFRELVDRSGTTIADVEFRRCAFRHCLISTEDVAKRSRIHNVNVIDCEEFNCRISESVIEDVTIDGLRVNDLFIVSDCAFKHVVLKGKVGRLKVTSGFAGLVRKLPKLQIALDVAHKQFYENVDWALDISKAEFEDFDISGVPMRLIRRDAETQVVLPAEVTLAGDWRSLPGFNHVWGPRIDAQVQLGASPELLLVARKRNKNFNAELAALAELRIAGLISET